MKELTLIAVALVAHNCYLEYRLSKTRNVLRAMITLMFEEEENGED